MTSRKSLQDVITFINYSIVLLKFLQIYLLSEVILKSNFVKLSTFKVFDIIFVGYLYNVL